MYRQKKPLVQTRLDYWFISGQLESIVDKCDIMPSITPDHAGICLELRYAKRQNKRRGKSYWKFNNSLCLDKEFVEGMISEIRQIKRQWAHAFRAKSLFWDFLKMKMREFTMRYSKIKAKARRSNIEQLENDLRKLENDILNNPNSVTLVSQIEEKKKKLKELYKNSLEGLKVRSRASWYEEGEKHKEYFEQLLQSNKKKTVIEELYGDQNVATTDKDAILKIIRSFYEELYSENKNEIGDYTKKGLFGKKKKYPKRYVKIVGMHVKE